jgi:archaellum component FlaD/FlaE
MGIFGKRKGKEAEAAPSGGGIRDLSEGPPQGMNGSLGPPSDDAMAPPPEGEMFTEEVPEGAAMAVDMEEAQAPLEPMAQAPMPPPQPTGRAPPAPPAPASFQPAPSPSPPPSPSTDMAMAAPAPSVQAAGGLERLDSVEQRMSDMSRRVDLLDRSSDDIRNDISRIRDSIAQIEGDMRELTSLYDLISTQINPFIDTSAMEEKPAIAVDQGTIPDLDALFEPTPELSPGGPLEGGEPSGAAGAQAGETPVAEGLEGEEGAAEGRPARPARLVRIGADASCHLALMEWIRFLLERVNRTEIPSVLSFYQRIGWISGEIKADMLEIIRGVGAVAGEPPAPAAAGPAATGAKDESGDIVIAYGKEQARELKGPAKGARGAGAGRAAAAPQPSATWRLTTDDHIASLMYIEWIRSGGDLDRDKLEEIHREVSRLKGGPAGFLSL